MAGQPLNNNEAIDLLINIPVPNCSSLNTDATIVKCEGNMVDGVYNLPAFMNVIFQFIIVAGITVVVFMAILQGFKILFYSPIASKIKDAKASLVKLITTLIILMFSVVILNQINPKLIDGSLDITNITRVEMCDDIDEREVCLENNTTCEWSDGKCQNITTNDCVIATEKTKCDPKKCDWSEVRKVCEIKNIQGNELACFTAGTDSYDCSLLKETCELVSGCYPKEPSAVINKTHPAYNCSALASKYICSTNSECVYIESNTACLSKTQQRQKLDIIHAYQQVKVDLNGQCDEYRLCDASKNLICDKNTCINKTNP
ncbi:hypothetical protein IT409_02505 [Candidatus Falkowbacteria bacterium]|nr:hypothetical protein [Candidatus Falkowbacteria bacterium]